MVGDTGSAAGSQRQISRFLEVRLKADLDGTRCDLLIYVSCRSKRNYSMYVMNIQSIYQSEINGFAGCSK